MHRPDCLSRQRADLNTTSRLLSLSPFLHLAPQPTCTNATTSTSAAARSPDPRRLPLLSADPPSPARDLLPHDARRPRARPRLDRRLHALPRLPPTPRYAPALDSPSLPLTSPPDSLEITYSRSSGPGGQNVNKLSTKATTRLLLPRASYLPSYLDRKSVV